MKVIWGARVWGFLGALILGLWGMGVETASAAVVTVPAYPCVMNEQEVAYQNSQYPLLSYKNVTYFPMTYGYCQALEVSTAWVEGEGLYIAYFPNGETSGELPVYAAAKNGGKQNAEVVNYPVYINGKRINNASEEYPLLNFRGVTYLPMTWKYAQEEFHWKTNWDGKTFSVCSSAIAGDDRSVSMSVCEVGDKNALLYRLVSESILLDAATESYTVKDTEGYISFDYATEKGTQTTFERDGYTSYALWQEAQTEAMSGKLSFANGKLVYAGQELAQVVKEGVKEEELSGYANCNVYHGVETYHFIVYTDSSIPAPYTPRQDYAYVKQDGKWIFVGENAMISNAVKGANGELYVTLNFFTGWKGSYIPAEQLYCVGTDGTVQKIIDRYPDYGSMKILGQAGGKVYLKCEWFKDYSPATYAYKISPYNDGYFTFDGKTLTKVAPYVYTDADFVTPDGRIYGLIDWKDEVRRIN